MAKITKPEINIIPKFTISGLLSSLIKGLEQVSDALPESFVGLPIHDEHGNKIGTITHLQTKLPVIFDDIEVVQ